VRTRRIRLSRAVLSLLPFCLLLAGCAFGVSGSVIHPKVLRLGQTATDQGVGQGFRRITVFTFVYPAPMADGRSTNSYAAANVQVCAGSHGAPKPKGPAEGPDALAPGWEVNFDPGTEGGGHVAGASSSTSTLEPTLAGQMALKPNQCARGWLTFEVDGVKPYYVSFSYPYTYWKL
jgi:hypothetical protein